MTLRYAGFWIRFVAEVIDSLLISFLAWIVQWSVLGAVFWIRRLMGLDVSAGVDGLISPLYMQVLNLVIYVLLSVPYYVIGHYRYGTTLGKVGLRVYVVNAADGRPITLKQSIVRCLGYFVSYLPLMAGYLMAAFHPQRRALHDLIAGTVSVRRVPRPPAPPEPAVPPVPPGSPKPDSLLSALLVAVGVASCVSIGSVHAAAIEGALDAASLASLGARLEAGASLQPVAERAFWIGPRLSVARFGGNAERTDFGIGAQGALWIVNLAAPSATVRWVPGSDGAASRFQVEPYFQVRLLRCVQGGACAVRGGAIYDTGRKWGAFVGLSLQLSGVPGPAGQD